eukprot:gene9289-10269_t
MLNDNSGWPESFGFSIAGDAAVVVISVLDNSTAYNEGLKVGDQILEINDRNVRGLRKDELILVARRSKQCPPSLSVISRIRQFRLNRRRRVGFGMQFRGEKPVYVQSVVRHSPAHEAGICPGDMLIKVNGRSVKNLDGADVIKVLEQAGNAAKFLFIAGSYAIKKFATDSSIRLKKTREFFTKMNYYLTGEEHKKTSLISLLKRYGRDRDIVWFSYHLSSLLTSDVQRGFLKHVRYFIPARHRVQFDAIVNQNANSVVRTSAGSTKISPSNSPRDQAEEITTGNRYPKTSPRTYSAGQKSWLSKTSTPHTKKDATGTGFASIYTSVSKASQKSSHKSHPSRPPLIFTLSSSELGSFSLYKSVILQRKTGNSSFGFTISGCKPVFIRSIDEDGPAVSAGLKPGDCIIDINGLNVRNASHEAVIELLKNSGTFPTLIVKWRPLPANLDTTSSVRSRGQSDATSERRQLRQRDGDSPPDSALEIDLSPRNGFLENSGIAGLNDDSYDADLVKHLKVQMKKLLTRGEQLVVKQSLAFFHKDRDVSRLIEALEPVLDDPLKLQMLHCISRLLPASAQLEFEKQAVDMVARHMDNGIIISAATTDHEIFDILFRVQGSKLADTSRPRNLIGGLADVNADSSWPGMSNIDSLGSLGLALDQTPPKNGQSNNDLIELNESPIKDSTFDALMSIDESKMSSHGSFVVTTADVHRNSEHQQQQQRPSQTDDNNNDDDAVFVNGGLSHPSEQDIENLKAELLLAQEEAKKAREESEERKLALERQGISLGKTNGAGPKSIADAIQEKAFEMEPEKIKSTSTDDHVVLPRQFPPPGLIPPPPPPPPPAPPAPPPPPGIGGKNAMQLKRINWEKVSSVSLENTVWGKLQSEDELDGIVDFMELDQLFSTKNKPIKEKKSEKKQTSILETKKIYNLSILLGHLKMPIEEVYEAVLSIDETKLTEPHIRTLLMCAPERNEVEAYKNFSDDAKTMSTADAFTSKMMTVTNYVERLRAMLFKARFNDRISEIEPDIKNVSLASEEVKSSKKLLKILEIVLATGNYMNKGSSTMSGASGFKISFLTKLISTKTSDNKSTLLHVIVSTIKNNKSELLDVKEELPHVALAAKVSSQMLSLEISELRSGMKEISDELKNYTVQDGDTTDRFKKVLGVSFSTISIIS